MAHTLCLDLLACCSPADENLSQFTRRLLHCTRVLTISKRHGRTREQRILVMRPFRTPTAISGRGNSEGRFIPHVMRVHYLCPVIQSLHLLSWNVSRPSNGVWHVGGRCRGSRHRYFESNPRSDVTLGVCTTGKCTARTTHYDEAGRHTRVHGHDYYHDRSLLQNHALQGAVAAQGVGTE